MTAAPSLRADRGIVLRTPLLPFETLEAWREAGDLAAQRRWLAELVARADVREALFVASPSLADRVDDWRRAPDEHRAIEHALVKYVARMAGRATPFGLFSGVTAGTLGRATTLELGAAAEYRRRTRLDNDYLFALGDAIAREPVARDRLAYRPNSSLYEAAGRLRYAEAELVDRQRTYHLCAIEPTPYLRATLERARSGARRAELAEALVDEVHDVSADDALAYIDELIDAQVLVPALGVAITGAEPIAAFVDQLAEAGLAGPRGALAGVRGALDELDRRIGNAPARYREIAARLGELPGELELARLFQVDLVKPGAPVLGTAVVAEVARALDWLRHTTRPPVTASLDELRRAFVDRYEGRTVPLAEALDEETGIGFESAGRAEVATPLLAGLELPEAPPGERVAWGPREVHLLRRVARLAPGAELVLDDADTRALAVATPPAGLDALAAMIRIAGTPEQVARGEHAILVEEASGPSGARWLGRFCHADPAIAELVRTHLRAEEALRPDAVFAEVVHLNEGRIGNILCRPVLRDHEVVYLGISGAPPERQLTIDDLAVAVRGDRIVLTSRRLGREVLPRLSAAHNFRLRSLAIYRFLCALQNQGDELAIGWSWGPLAALPRLPRVRLGSVVLARESWSLDAADLAPVTAAVRAAAGVARAVAELRERCGLPRWVALADEDHELPIDLDHPMLVAAFADELAGAKTARLVELFPAPDALPVRGPEGHFTNELVLTFTRARAVPPVARASDPPTGAAQRSFTPASPWLYVKLYAGAGTTDRVLRALAPALRELVARGDATHWFFVRYGDPRSHVRLRVAGDPPRLHGHVLAELERAVAPLVDCGAVSRIQLDTYERELERYGGDAGIELCERLFWIDSEAVLEIVELLDGDAGARARWQLAVRGCDQLLEALGIADARRAEVFATARDELGREHRADAALYRRLGERWKAERAELEDLLARDPARDAVHPLAPALAALDRRTARLAELRDALRAVPGFDAMAWSLVHMHVNRLLHGAHRTQELVIYDFLRRWHESRRARRAIDANT